MGIPMNLGWKSNNMALQVTASVAVDSDTTSQSMRTEVGERGGFLPSLESAGAGVVARLGTLYRHFRHAGRSKLTSTPGSRLGSAPEEELPCRS